MLFQSVENVIVFAIGMKKEAVYDQLRTAATSEDFIRTYETMDEFAADVDEISFETCWIPPPLEAVNDSLVELALRGLEVGETRYLRIGYTNDTLMNVRFDETGLELTAYFSLNFPFPSEAIYDYKLVIYQNGTRTMVLPNGNTHCYFDRIKKIAGRSPKCMAFFLKFQT